MNLEDVINAQRNLVLAVGKQAEALIKIMNRLEAHQKQLDDLYGSVLELETKTH